MDLLRTDFVDHEKRVLAEFDVGIFDRPQLTCFVVFQRVINDGLSNLRLLRGLTKLRPVIRPRLV